MSESEINLVSGKMHFHLILADVVFETKRGGITSHRVQFLTQSSTEQFPGDRIQQLQNSAARIVLGKLGEKKGEGFKVHDVLFLNMHYCGHMLYEEFYGEGATAKVDVVDVDKSTSLDKTETSVSAGETRRDDNVVSLPLNNPSN